jgi:hypothetical protein
MLAFGVESPRHLEHLLGEIGEGHGEGRFEVDGVVAASAPQLQDFLDRDRGRTEQPGGMRRLLGVSSGGEIRGHHNARSP